MPHKYPFMRTCRQFVDGTYAESGKWRYIHDKNYATDPEHYVRAFELIQKDLLHLISFIEMADTNLPVYSFRIYELFIRTCVEIETNFKAILIENGYNSKRVKSNSLNISDFKKLDSTHRLSSYEVKIPYWKGKHNLIRPFERFALNQSSAPSANSTPDWYNAYNLVKHNRHKNFHQASFTNLIQSVCGLVVLLSAQFYTEDFYPGDSSLTARGFNDGMDTAIGGFFRIKFPDWPIEDQYDFDSEDMKEPGWMVVKLFDDHYNKSSETL